MVLDAVFRWVSHDPEDRVLELRSLLPYVHLSSTSQVCRDRVLSYGFTKCDPGQFRTYLSFFLFIHLCICLSPRFFPYLFRMLDPLFIYVSVSLLIYLHIFISFVDFFVC